MSIESNLKEVIEKKNAAAIKSGRKPEDVTLVAVTKLHEPDEMNEAIDAGAADIGENKVQEILRKYDDVKPVRWHLIGHLQTNKVKSVIGKVCMIHSVDSLHLAKEIDKRAGQAGLVMDILIQINIGNEDSKFGAAPEEADTLISEIAQSCSNVRIRGLMCVAPYEEDPEKTRPYFARMKKMYDSYAEKGPQGIIDFKYLSMGMTNDYVQAIEEGSNMIRVGTAIFGARNYRQEEK
jgi:pyridoxal phosphate enzyme (YggS family)